MRAKHAQDLGERAVPGSREGRIYLLFQV